MHIIDPDSQFFIDHPDRKAHIRLPRKELVRTPQRAMVYADECAGEFFSLGEHNKNRRRILLWVVPGDNPYYKKTKRPILKIPYLLFADETVEDRDDVLLPIIHQIMCEAAQ